MTSLKRDLVVIGRVEKAQFPTLDLQKVPVKIDTGADACAIWATVVEQDSGHLHVTFFGESSPLYTGKIHEFGAKDYEITRVANSFGHKELRYKVKLVIKIKNRTIRGSFTLSDRADKLYPVLIGRSLLHNKFLVDVSKGSPLIHAEKERKVRLKATLNNLKGDR